MIEAILTEQKRRRWNPFRRRRFVLRIPQGWAEVTPLGKREKWWKWVAMLPPEESRLKLLRDLVPKRWRLAMSVMDLAGVAKWLEWAEARPEAENIPIEAFFHKGIRYVFPNAKGANVSCVEFALCEDYYKQFLEGDTAALLRLSACIWREEDDNAREQLKRGDDRVLLFSKEEVEARVKLIAESPEEIHVQAYLWWIGMKMLIHKMYGAWIFDNDEEEDEQDETAYAKASAGKAGKGPNFGWWGIYLDVAESGVFGALEKVYQTSIHDICIFLVKKRADANQAPEPKTPLTDPDED